MQTSKVKINTKQMLGFRLINNHKSKATTEPTLIGSKIGGKVGTKTKPAVIGSKIGDKAGIGLIGSKIGEKPQ